MLHGTRPARIDEAAQLTELCARATISYGYNDETIRRFEPALTVNLTLIASGLTFVAEDRDKNVVGVMAIRPTPLGGLVLLDRVFVDPSAQRKGIGRRLFSVAVDQALQMNGSAILIYAHPLAAGFYRRLGAVQIGETPFYLAPDLKMPMMIYSVPSVAGHGSNREERQHDL